MPPDPGETLRVFHLHLRYWKDCVLAAALWAGGEGIDPRKRVWGQTCVTGRDETEAKQRLAERLRIVGIGWPAGLTWGVTDSHSLQIDRMLLDTEHTWAHLSQGEKQMLVGLVPLLLNRPMQSRPAPPYKPRSYPNQPHPGRVRSHSPSDPPGSA